MNIHCLLLLYFLVSVVLYVFYLYLGCIFKTSTQNDSQIFTWSENIFPSLNQTGNMIRLRKYLPCPSAYFPPLTGREILLEHMYHSIHMQILLGCVYRSILIKILL